MNTTSGLIVVCAAAALVLGFWALEQHSNQSPPLPVDLKQVSGPPNRPQVWHDTVRNTTCWVFDTGTSCIPDWQLTAPGRE